MFDRKYVNYYWGILNGDMVSEKSLQMMPIKGL